VVTGDVAVLVVVVDVLAQVVDGAVGRLGVVVEGDLVQDPVVVAAILHDRRVDALAANRERLGATQEPLVRADALAVDNAPQDPVPPLRQRQIGVVDPGRVAERRRPAVAGSGTRRDERGGGEQHGQRGQGSGVGHQSHQELLRSRAGPLSRPPMKAG
jgi:hypothetical protein